jgi:hypothetical protein
MRFACVIFSAILLSTAAHGFEPTFKRTLSGNDWFRTFQRQFPLGAAITPREVRSGNQSDGLCRWRTFNGNVTQFGDMDPGTGEFAPKRPNANFMAWLGRCIDQLALLDFSRALAAGQWPSRLSENPSQLPVGLYDKPWTELPSEDRLAIIKFQVKRLIGPGLVAREDDWVARVDQALVTRNLKVRDAYLKIVAWVAARPEYLDY